MRGNFRLVGKGCEFHSIPEVAHVNADLGKNCLCSQGLDARDGAYLLDGGAKGLYAGLHLSVDSGNGI